MYGRLGPLEILLLLVIIVLVFGVGRISKVAEELGKSIRAFREGLKGDEEPSDRQKPEDS